MNVMGQLIDKAKRVIVMRTVTSEKPQAQQMPPHLSQNQISKPILPIRIQELEAKIENRPTTVDEKSPAVLKYRTPHFR